MKSVSLNQPTFLRGSMPSAKKDVVKKAILTADDERYIQHMHAQQKLADPWWTTRSDELYEKYERRWVVFDQGEVVFHTASDKELSRWLDRNDPGRNRFLLRWVPAADADFVFPTLAA